MSTDPTVRNTRVILATWQSEYKALKAIRTTVFIIEQGVPVADEWDQLDATSWHYLALNAEDQPIGCGRLTPEGQISRMAVLKGYRGQGVGQALMATILAFARQRFERLHLHAQLPAIAFYEQFGFTLIGPTFEDAGILHRPMALSAPQKNQGFSDTRPPTNLIRAPELAIDEVSAADYIAAIAELVDVTPAPKSDAHNPSRHVEYFIATAFEVIQGSLMLLDGAFIDSIRLRTGASDEVALALIDAAKSKALRYQFDQLYLSDPAFSKQEAAQFGFELRNGARSLALASLAEPIGVATLSAEPSQTKFLDLNDPKTRQYIRGLPDCIVTIASLVQLSTTRIRLWTPTVDVALYSHAALMAHFKNLALKNKHTRIEILLTDSRSLVEQGHLLLELSRRLPSSIQIKRAAPEHADSVEEALLIDDRTVFFRPSHSDYHAWVCLDDVLAARRLHEAFKVAWQNALEDSQLRVLKL
jgi:predicted GNAT family N-acyltransferase